MPLQSEKYLRNMIRYVSISCSCHFVRYKQLVKRMFCFSLWYLLIFCFWYVVQVHYSKQGQAFKSQAQSMHVEILQSPWLCELMAFHINLRDTKVNTRKAPAFFEGCYLKFNDDKPSLSCELFDSVKLDIDLTCSICLVSQSFILFL